MDTTLTYMIASAPYIIHDRPLDKLPIRRLQTEGADAISLNELLQVALGKGDGMDNLVQEYGTKFLTTLQTVPEVVEALHLDHLQATRLLAILAIGKRLYAPAQGSLVQVRDIEDVFNHYRFMSALAKEQLRVLVINSRYQLIHEEIIAVGHTDSLQITAKDVYQSAVERRASAVILVHNHPSGDPTPSEADLSFTKAMAEAATILDINLLDHVIIGRDSYQSSLTAKDRP
jgi:DNA repair protein RadC